VSGWSVSCRLLVLPSEYVGWHAFSVAGPLVRNWQFALAKTASNISLLKMQLFTMHLMHCSSWHFIEFHQRCCIHVWPVCMCTSVCHLSRLLECALAVMWMSTCVCVCCGWSGSAQPLCLILWWHATKLVVDVWVWVKPHTVCQAGNNGLCGNVIPSALRYSLPKRKIVNKPRRQPVSSGEQFDEWWIGVRIRSVWVRSVGSSSMSDE